MSSFGTTFGRVPDLLSSQLMLGNISRTNLDLFKISRQLSSGRAIAHPSEDSLRAATIAQLDSRLERSTQIVRNLETAAGSLDILDSALGDGADLLNEAKSIASAQIGLGATPEERSNQGDIVSSIMESMLKVANRESLVGFVFAGGRPGLEPVLDAGGSFRFTGTSDGLLTDLGGAGTVPVTIGADRGLGSVSARVQGTVDLDPGLTADTRIKDLDGARGLGVFLGEVGLSFNAGGPFNIDLASADTIGDVVDLLTAGIRAYEASSGDTVLGPGGVSFNAGSLTLDVPAGNLLFSDPQGTTTGADLGLASQPSAPFNAGSPNGADVAPRMTWTTPLTALNGLGGPLGQIRIDINGASRIVDLSGAGTVGDLRTLIEQAAPGARVEIGADGSTLSVVTEIAGGTATALSIHEVDDGIGRSASLLGIRSFDAGTAVADFNDGRGVQVVSGAVDPDGLPDPARDVDFTISIGDPGAGTDFEIDIDLQPADLTDLQSILDAINTQADAQLTGAGRPVTDFDVRLTDDDNGILLEQDPGLGGQVAIERKNNSTAPEQLGLLDASLGAGGSLLGADRATVRPDNVFTHLSDLRDALKGNDRTGIQLAAGKLDESLDRLITARGLVGSRARQVSEERAREEDRSLIDTSIRSQLQDLDFAAASVRFSQLQTQLQAGLSVTAQSSRLTLMDFLG